MQARAADIRDVARRILNNLLGVTEGGIDSEEPVILAADDLAPSETLQLNKSKILGFVTQGGSGSSHTAILARTMGIPAICGLGEQLKQELNGHIAYIDGETGKTAIDPDEITLMAFQAKLEKQQEMKRLMETMKGQEDVTLDGRPMMVYCNIGSPEDVAAVHSNDGQGIGLLRSEFLYLAADAAHKAGIWIGICGELGADLSLLETFLAIGIDELSVSPSSVLPLRAEIRKSIAKACTLERLEC